MTLPIAGSSYLRKFVRMKEYLVIATLLFTTVANAQSREVSFVISSASTIDRSVKWQPASVLKADFTCQGKQEFAILGTKPKEIVVAVFRPPAKKPVDVLRYSGVARNPESAVLEIESLDFDLKELEQQLGYAPDGLKPSRTCVGLNLSDQMVDSAHIYWHKKNRRFESWSL